MYRMKPSVVRMLVGVAISVVLAVSVGPARAAGVSSITPPDGSTLTGASQAFSWTGDFLEYWMYVGTSVGAKDIYNSGSLGTATSTTVTGLPTDGSTVYVRLWHREEGEWLRTRATFGYTAFSAGEGNSTLRWDRILDSTNGEANGCNSDRFKCIFPTTANPRGEAVLDLETGLVWERSAGTGGLTWVNALSHCARREVGGRKGWHLPLVEQLASLLDSSNSHPALPTGHPFQNVQTFNYWSATTVADDPSFARGVTFAADGHVFGGNKDSLIGLYTWCARAGQVFDGNTHTTLH
jgi:hypothetical protein